MKVLEKLISFLKKEPYSFEGEINLRDIIIILATKFFQLIRGFKYQLISMGKIKGLAFFGKRVQIKHSHLFQAGNNLTLENGVYINCLSKYGVSMGNNVKIGYNSIIECTGVIRELGECLTIGNNVGISSNCYIGVRGKVIIRNNTIVGPNVSFHAENHSYNDLEKFIRNQPNIRNGIDIGEDCWIGSGAIILDGVKLGNKVVVAAGSVVTKNFKDNVVIAGVPAKIIKEIGV